MFVVVLAFARWFQAIMAIVIIMILIWIVRRIPPRYDPAQTITRSKRHADCDKIMIVAHPDDELLFAGLGLLRETGWHVVCITHAGDKTRREEFFDAMGRTETVSHYTIMNHSDQRFCTSLHPQLVNDLTALLYERPWVKIATHNFRGEYGHPQHGLLARTIMEITPLCLYGQPGRVRLGH